MLETLYVVGGNVNSATNVEKTVYQFLNRLHIFIIRPSILLLSIYTQEKLTKNTHIKTCTWGGVGGTTSYMNVHSSIIHSNRKKTTQTPKN